VTVEIVEHILTHPELEDDDGNPIALEKVHFAEPFLGALYVVAEYAVTDSEQGDVHHFWLQPGKPWEPTKIYRHGDIVEPSEPNGLVYRAGRLGDPFPSWQPGTAYAVGARIEPTEYNDFSYEATATEGSSPHSGAIEPNWPTEPGATVTERTDAPDAPDLHIAPPVTLPPSGEVPQESVRERYLLDIGLRRLR
jgi:hypothetical protein